MRRFLSLAASLALLLGVTAAPVSAVVPCSQLVNWPNDGIWRSASLANVADLSVHVQIFAATLEVQPADGNQASRSYIEIRQSNDTGTANLGIQYNTSGAAFAFWSLRGSDGAYDIPLTVNGTQLSQGTHRFEIQSPDINHVYFYVDGFLMDTYAQWFSGEFYANQKTYVNGMTSANSQSPGGVNNPINFTDPFTQTQYGTVGTMIGTYATSDSGKARGQFVNGDLFQAWDPRCTS